MMATSVSASPSSSVAGTGSDSAPSASSSHHERESASSDMSSLIMQSPPNGCHVHRLLRGPEGPSGPAVDLGVVGGGGVGADVPGGQVGLDGLGGSLGGVAEAAAAGDRDPDQLARPDAMRATHVDRLAVDAHRPPATRQPA